MISMSRSVAAALAGASLLAGGLAAQEQPETRTGMEREAARIAAVLEAVFAATQTADYAALDTLYAGADLTIIEGAGIDRGWASYRDHHLKPELEEFEEFTYRPRNIEASVAGDLGWAHFEYDLLIELEDRTIDRVGRGTAVFERRGGRWVVRHMQTANRPRS